MFGNARFRFPSIRAGQQHNPAMSMFDQCPHGGDIGGDLTGLAPGSRTSLTKPKRAKGRTALLLLFP
jgi:hypothetical protein